MKSEFQPESRVPNPEPRELCGLCGGTGWRNVKTGNYSAVVRCEHGRNGNAPAGGFTSIADCRLPIEDLLAPPEKRIRELIARRHGRENAISIGEIAGQVFGVDRKNLGEWDKTVRGIKRTVEKLRLLGRIPIAATKLPPYGYFIPATAEEGDDCHDRLFTEGIRLIVLSQLFKRDSDLMQALRGQLELGTRDSRLATREVPNPEPRVPSPESREVPEAR